MKLLKSTPALGVGGVAAAAGDSPPDSFFLRFLLPGLQKNSEILSFINIHLNDHSR